MRDLRSMMVIVLVLLLLVSGIRCDANSISPDHEIEELKLKIASLESKCIDQEKEIKEKEERLSLLEKSIQERCTQVASSESEIELLQKGISDDDDDDDEIVQKVNARNHILEKKAEKLQIELETQVGKREALEAKVVKAEMTARQLSRRLEYAAKIRERQRLKMQNLERNLEISQIELGKVQASFNLEAEELEKLHGAWIPHWLTSFVLSFQEILSGSWNKLVRSVREGLIPTILEKWTSLKELIVPHVELASNAACSKTSDAYKICVDAMTPHYIQVRQMMHPYLQRVKKLFGSYFAGEEPQPSKEK